MMDLQRYSDLLHATSAYEHVGRSGADALNDDDVWMRRDTRLQRIHDLERKLFENSIKLLLNTRSGTLVVDDELVPSRASDEECKILSNRKKVRRDWLPTVLPVLYRM